MPELPEIHTITTDLNSMISGYSIKKVTVATNYRVLPNNTEFNKRLTGKTIKQVRRIAKNIIIEMEPKDFLVIHLGLTGRVLVRKPEEINDKWVWVVLRLGNKVDTKDLKYCDMRMFGKIGVLSEEEVEKLSQSYGPEPLNEIKDPKEFLNIIRSKKTIIKNILMDQSIVSGMGNIYVMDALFMAGIHPETPTRNITLEMAHKLLTSSKEILGEGIAHRGATLPDKTYVDPYGREGTQQQYFKIYMKKNCPVCGGKVTFKKIGGRGTYFCPVCQPLNALGSLPL